MPSVSLAVAGQALSRRPWDDLVAEAKKCTLLCLNCHAILSLRQKYWHRSCLTEHHPFRFLVQGVYDVASVWLERSPAVKQSRAFFAMLGHAALIAVAYVRLDALAELGAVNFRIGGA